VRYATITSKGRTTIPKEIREQFNLQAGDRILFFANDAGRIEIQPLIPITAVKGLLKRPGRKARSLRQIDRASCQGATRRFRRSSK
jgi:AbrB family looped-hinge helix DNA binding protein